MKIVFCNFNNGVYRYASGDPNAVGGAERQQWFLARGLASSGWSVVVAVQEAPELANGTIFEGVRFVSFTGNQASSSSYQRLLGLYRLLQSEHPDWCYWRCASHLWGPVAGIAKLAGAKTVFAVGFDSDVQPSRALSQRANWWPLYALGLFASYRILLQHQAQLSALSNRLRSKAAIVPSIAYTPPNTKPHDKRERYVAWVGMLRQPKRPDLLVEIARKAQPLRFVVCGAPTEHRSPNGYGSQIVTALKSLSNVDYRGQVTSEEAQEVIGNASLLLCTSEGEGFPNVFLEAWASGTPVVSLTIDPDHITVRKQLGLVSPDTETAVVDLTRLVDQPARRDEMAVHCRQHVADAHSEVVVMSQMIQALNGAATQAFPCGASARA